MPRLQVLGQQSDVDDADLVRFARDVKPPGRLAVHEDDVERRARVVLLVVGVLRVELHRHERGLLRGIPLHCGELGLASTRVDREEKRAVVRDDGPQRDGCGPVPMCSPAGGHPLAGKTPCSAMQKLTVRYGCMLLWGRPPPANPSAMGFIGVRPVAVGL